MKKDFEEEYQKFFNEAAKESCKSCGGELKPELINLEELWEGKLFLMERVPAFVCQECGEIWVPEEFTKEFESMVTLTKKRRKTKPNSKKKN